MICLSNLLVLLQSSGATGKALQRLQSISGPHQHLPPWGGTPPLLRKGSPACFQHSSGRHKASYLPFGAVSQWRSSDCPWALPVHFRVRLERWLTTATSDVWQLMLLIPSAIGSLLSTKCYPMSGRAEKKLKQLLKSPDLQPRAVREPGISASRLSKAQWKLQWFKKLLPNIYSSPWSWGGNLHRGPVQTSGSGNCFSHIDFHPPAFMNQQPLTRVKLLLKAVLVHLCDFNSKLSRHP